MMTATERPERQQWKPPYDYPLSDQDGDSYCIAVADFSDKSRWAAIRTVAAEIGEDVTNLRAGRGVVYEHFCDDDSDDPNDYYCWCGGEGRDGTWSEWSGIKHFKESRKRLGIEVKFGPHLVHAYVVTFK